MNITPTMFPDTLLDDLPFGEFWPDPEPMRSASPQLNETNMADGKVVTPH